ncbi:hypothetical protein Nepgr_012580 [Nepenthes gracilis]|uniref:DNA topoisomerase n=1 Tax=Nepenthes gracilis TaxID=150966 RepID=A0AAD3XNA0_NEPGR|nr:hypothetical protein Nepgr_012580 [Nepenthes gracilis]
MALIRIQRNLLGGTSTASFCTFSILNSYKHPQMAQLHCRALRSHLDASLPCSPIGICDTYRMCKQVKFKKVRISCKMTNHQSTIFNLDQQLGSYLSESHIDGSRNGIFFQSLSRLRFANSLRCFRILSSTSSANTVILGSSNYVKVAVRTFSINALPESQAMNASESFAKDQTGYQNSVKFRGFNKHKKPVRAVAARVSGDSAVPNTTPYQFTDGKEAQALSSGSSSGGNQVSKKELRLNQRSKGKKKKTELSSTLSSSDANPSRSCSGASKEKSCENNTDGQSSQIVENGLSGSTPTEVIDVSVSTKQLSKKTTTRSRRKGKSVKEVVAVTKTNGAVTKPGKNVQQVPSSSKASKKPKPQTMGKIKPRGSTLKPLYPPTGKSVVVVESLTKAKVIQGYLGDMYEVLPSYGHVRDLAARSGSVRPDDDFSMVWEVPSSAWTHLKSIKVSITGADNLILASDPDREGEAIAWHIVEMLQQQDALHKDITVARVVFQEVTETAIKSSLQSPKDIDANLVYAYLARRALDYLIGFNISPLLWKKLPGCQSAGRVQSAALSLICDREMEIDEFKPQEFWTVEALFKTDRLASQVHNFSIVSYLTHYDSKKLNQFSVGSETEAKDILRAVNSSNFKVIGSKRSKIHKNPPTPFITSTLQQDAANKLRFPATFTMKLAQKLYEGVQLSDGRSSGLITYMRTDGLHMSDEALEDICSLITERFGQQFVPETPRKYFKKVKNAQEAHEAIRPTDIRRFPSTLVGTLDEDSLKLYTLIWSRTVACQMEAAKIDQIQVDIGNDGECIAFRAACSRVDFIGYRAVYEDVEAEAINKNGIEVDNRDEAFNILSNMKLEDECHLDQVELKQHHSQPPPRYSEASLVKKLEELGIGRPSTYATTLKVLQDRKYVNVKARVLYPEFRGRMVSAFLSHHFSEVMDYSFTADMETELDNVSAGLTDWKGLLRDYWTRFSTYCERASKVHIHQVEKLLERTFGDFLFSSLPDDSRACPSCLEGTLIFKVSRFGEGYFIGCDQHPKCKYIAKTLYGDEEDDDSPQENTVEEPKLLGLHPISNEKVFLKNGPYGFYVQLGEDRKGYVPKRTSVSQMKDVDSITLEDALELLRYPIQLGNHPADGMPVVLKIAKMGFTIRHRRHIAPVPKNLKPSDITFEKALELLSGEGVRRCGRPKSKPKLEEAIEAF